MISKLIPILYSVIYAVLNITGATIIKMELKNTKLIVFKDWLFFLLNYKVIFAFALIFLASLVVFKALSGSQISFVIPVATGVNFFLSVIIGYYFFKDSLNNTTFIGLALILLGIIILAINQSK